MKLGLSISGLLRFCGKPNILSALQWTYSQAMLVPLKKGKSKCLEPTFKLSIYWLHYPPEAGVMHRRGLHLVSVPNSLTWQMSTLRT